VAQMLKAKGCRPVSCRTRLTIGGFLAFLLVSGFFAGCYERQSGDEHVVRRDEAAFHKVLTLLFDGVPPLEDKMVEPGAGSIDPNVPDAPKRPEFDWCIHEPLKDCIRCHGNQQQESFSREVQLVANVPGLCYQCHESLAPTVLNGWVHGPVAIGQCLVCHEPHKTTIPHLLKDLIPALCYSCHQELADELTLENVKGSHSQCMSCHAAHASSKPYATNRVPQMCYECHESLVPTALEGRVHGPVAVGQCLLCHNLHKIENPHLLRERIPALCYACHEEAAIKLIRDHSRESYIDCSNCHEGHVSPERPLLRPSTQQKSAESKVPERVSGPSGQ